MLNPAQAVKSAIIDNRRAEMNGGSKIGYAYTTAASRIDGGFDLDQALDELDRSIGLIYLNASERPLLAALRILSKLDAAQVYQLRDEAGVAGDSAMVATCTAALAGNYDACFVVAEALAGAEVARV